MPSWLSGDIIPDGIPEADCANIAATGADFYIAPGVNCCLSFAGRLDYAVHNTREAVELGKKYNARGIINTSWGDSGNHYAWSSIYPGLLLVAYFLFPMSGKTRPWLREALKCNEGASNLWKNQVNSIR